MTYCPQCGYALRGGVLICPACGTKTVENIGNKAEEAKTFVPQPPVLKAEVSQAAPQEDPENSVTEDAFPIPEPLAEKESAPIKTGYGDNILPTGKYALLSTGGYLLNQILFMLPGIGFIIAIIMACAAKKVNRRRHALSAVILHIICIIIAAAGIGAIAWLGIENIPLLTR